MEFVKTATGITMKMTTKKKLTKTTTEMSTKKTTEKIVNTTIKMAGPTISLKITLKIHSTGFTHWSAINDHANLFQGIQSSPVTL